MATKGNKAQEKKNETTAAAMTDVLKFKKSTKGTHVYESETLQTIYLPKLLPVFGGASAEPPAALKVTIEVEESEEA